MMYNDYYMQEGGEMPAEAPEAPEAAPQGNPIEQMVMEIVAMAEQDPEQAAQAALQFVMMLAEQMGGGGAPAVPEEAPVFRKGGKIIALAKKGAKMQKMEAMKLKSKPKMKK